MPTRFNMQEAYFLVKPHAIEQRLVPAIFEILYESGLMIYGYSERTISLQQAAIIYTPDEDTTKWHHVIKMIGVIGRCGLITAYADPGSEKLGTFLKGVKGSYREDKPYNPFTIRGKLARRIPKESSSEASKIREIPAEDLSYEEMIEMLRPHYFPVSIVHTPDDEFETDQLLRAYYGESNT